MDNAMVGISKVGLFHGGYQDDAQQQPATPTLSFVVLT